VSLARLALTLALAAPICLAAPAASAEPEDATATGQALPDLKALAGDLELTSDQLARIRALTDAGRKQQVALRAEMEVLEIDLRSELERPTPDEAKVGAWAEKLGSLDGRLRKSRILTWVRLRRVLSVRQQRRLESMHGQPAIAEAGRPGQTGMLRIASSPPARISVDGRAVGVTPLELALTPGTHRVMADANGYVRTVRALSIQAGQSTHLSLSLTADASGATGGCDEVTCLIEPDKPCCPKVHSRVDYLARAVVSAGIAAVRDQVNACGTKHGFTGNVVATITIAPSGRTSSVSVDTRESVGHCVAAAIKGARFPPAQKSTTVRYPFIFH
jgi:Spy/CpxP family protein refolding chaperone